MMRSKKILVALVACMALTAVAANAAQAALHWTVNGGTTLAGPETVTVVSDIPGPGAWLLSGTTLGTTVELTAENVVCGSTCTIEGAGASSGSLKFTGVTVMKPAGCSAGNPGKAAGTLTTASLRDQIKMDKNVAGSTVVFDEFSPVTAGGSFVQIEFSGATCTLGEIALPVKGTAEGEAGHTELVGIFVSNATGKQVSSQLLRFGSTQQTTGGGALTLATGSVTLTGIASNTLSGNNSGEVFGATE
jgi:hypothetical protein